MVDFARKLHAKPFWTVSSSKDIARYDVPSPSGRSGGGATGLYSGTGRGLLNGLISFFFGFFFSRLRLSRLPMTIPRNQDELKPVI
jgi:hypothetical protein